MHAAVLLGLDFVQLKDTVLVMIGRGYCDRGRFYLIAVWCFWLSFQVLQYSLELCTLLPPRSQQAILVSALESRPRCMQLFAALSLPDSISQLQPAVVSALVEAVRQSLAMGLGLSELLTAYTTGPTMDEFLSVRCALESPKLSTRALHLLSAALATVPEAVLRAEGGAVVTA